MWGMTRLASNLNIEDVYQKTLCLKVYFRLSFCSERRLSHDFWVSSLNRFHYLTSLCAKCCLEAMFAFNVKHMCWPKSALFCALFDSLIKFLLCSVIYHHLFIIGFSQSNARSRIVEQNSHRFLRKSFPNHWILFR